MDFFKKCFVINLDRRPDRYNDFKNSIPFDSSICERFSAIDGKTITNYSVKENPYVMGCHLSHKKILENVINDDTISNDEFIIIFEDDVFFTKNFIKDVENIKKSKDIIDLNSIIYIGGRFKISFKPSSYTGWSFLKNNIYLKGNYKNITSPDYDRTTNVIILSKFACKEIIEKTKDVKASIPIDSLYNNIRKYIPDMKLYDLFPHLCYSPVDYKTDIQNYVL